MHLPERICQSRCLLYLVANRMPIPLPGSAARRDFDVKKAERIPSFFILRIMYQNLRYLFSFISR
jgi:hypothetical protein